ncbi:hypothetical protein L1D15_00260 [Vibrio sp. Isolate25]|uniref:hypothetical protein n=1 Tax=Vibrio sp. Isolate25 TaxID=2908535 RepID=UPI001EFE1FCC|nr:hypothetical protein [Vibrio sp. Isolate25]MCG9595143.1 hypothetical protein [Vibrio sp. Isolate25]
MNFIKSIFFVVIFSQSVHAEILGQWTSEKSSSTYFLKIEKNSSERLTLKYFFTFDNGRKINDRLEAGPPIILNKMDTNCYKGETTDPFSSSNPKFIICQEDNLLVWSKISQIESSPYTPNYLVLNKKID